MRRLYKENPSSEIYQWMMFLDNPNSEEVDAIMKENKDICEATSNLEDVCDDEELQRLVDYTVSQQKAQYDNSLTEMKNDSSSHNDGYESDEEYEDPLYNEIVDYIIQAGKVSASLIQRKYRLGYNRAARIIDLLEERGIIGPQNGSKPREVLIKKDSEEE